MSSLAQQDTAPARWGVNQRFEDMKDLWRAELGWVEEVLDARLKALEAHWR